MNAKQVISKLTVFLIMAVLLIGSPLILTAETAEKDKDVIIRAMSDELDRSMKSLQIEKMDKPYFLEYTVEDTLAIDIEGSFGSLINSAERHKRLLKVGLRVGSYQLDNSEFLGGRNFFFGLRGRTYPLVTEDDYDTIRHDIWLSTDKAYKEALKQLAAKEAFIKNQADDEQIPDFSKEKNVQLIAPRKTVKVDRAKWEKAVKNLSGIFRKFPTLHDSGVEMNVRVNHKYYINSEGSLFRQPEILVRLVAHASTRGGDGAKLKHYVPFYAASMADMPGEKEMAAGVRKMAEELTALAAAPLLDEYIGPVLFSRQASGELFSQVLVPHLSGERPPLSQESRMSSMIKTTKLGTRLNRKVLPRDISIADDPTRTVYEKTPLIGSYKIDDQGVLPQPVKLVEAGTLKTLLMSRRPRKEITASNGHARSAAAGKSGAHVSNLFITSKAGKTYPQLKKELLQLCEDQQLPFGLIVKSVDNPGITGSDLSISALLMGSQGAAQMTSPVMLYKVYVKDGKEELVRGLSFGDINLKSLRDLYAVGNDYYVHNCLFSSGGGGGFAMFAFAAGGDRSLGIPGSLVVPSVLFEELEFKKNTGTKKNPPLLGHPYFK